MSASICSQACTKHTPHFVQIVLYSFDQPLYKITHFQQNTEVGDLTNAFQHVPDATAAVKNLSLKTS